KRAEPDIRALRHPDPVVGRNGVGNDDIRKRLLRHRMLVGHARIGIGLHGRHRRVPQAVWRAPGSRRGAIPAGWRRVAPVMNSTALSATTSTAALVLPDTMVGIADASMTRRPVIPRTRMSAPSTPPCSLSRAMRQVPTGW